VTRIPERYPLTTEYYRALIGCPAEKDVIWCYNVAKPGQFEGQLGYKLAAVFESYPTLEIPGLFKYEFNDQFAEEAFTVYDHPKVLIFQKTDAFDAQAVRAHLSAVDLSNVVHLTPKQASHYKPLMLPADRLAQQQAGGTWSDLFSYDWIQNRYPFIGLLLWYLFIFALGVIAYPLTRLALPGLADKGYPVSRAVGMLLLAYLSWLVGSLGGTYSRATIGAVFVVLAAAGLSLGWMRRDELRAEWKSNRRYYLIVEGIFLAFFIIDLLIRLGNPDLWHPAKGGERPMDFSYFNAILKSANFPPYDPWFAGGYINYYYYGFVLVGTPVKLLGIVPSIAYNFILPTLFAMVALGAFSLGWNLLSGRRTTDDGQWPIVNGQWAAGISASLLTVLLGNLGTIRMLFQGFQRMAAPGGVIDNANVVQRWLWALKGFYLAIAGGALPFGRGDWYWFPSRVIPAPGDVEPINEFPLFTFLYSDLHAHMIVMPIALLALAWALSTIKSRAKMGRLEWIASFFLGGLTLGALYPTNLSDIYTYLLIALAALAYVLWFHADTTWLRLRDVSDQVKRLFVIGAGVAVLVFLSHAFYEPYRAWYGQAYGAVDPWPGSHTPIWSYLTHWGLFLFIITAWLVWETREWMAVTPVSALGRLRPYQILIELLFAGFIAFLVYFAVKGISIGWLALPLAAWAGILLLRRDMPDEKRLVLFWIGTALLITIVVELVVVRGDIGRMNTVFKFYLQAWLLFAVSAAAAFGWLLLDIHKWLPRWRNIFQMGISLLAAGAFLFTLSASTDKIADRMAPNAPHTLDSMNYMAYATYWDGENMDLSRDYRAIRWMQDNVKGSPVIVEANCPEYRWCTRFTIYTGLPGVVGWNWHQRQQRVLMAVDAVTSRVAEIGNFYNTTEIDFARAFLKKYNVKYIIVGQLEHIMYPGGAAKFEIYDGKYWRSIYRDADTVIYEVIP
jgi:YYY domain-containing protein